MSQERDSVGVLAIMYHYVRDRAGTAWAGIRGLDTDAFCGQLDLLCRWAEPISWPMLFAWRRGEASIPQRCFLLTFDDGLADHAEVVLPILETRGLRGAFFVSGQVLESGRMDGAHQVHLLQAKLGDERFAEEVTRWLADEGSGGDWLGSVDGGQAELVYHYETASRARIKYLLGFVLPIELRNRMLDALFERFVGCSEALARQWYMGWEDLVMLEGAGHTVGGHGFGHDPLLRMSVDEQTLDLSRSAALLRQGLGPEIRPMSYPFGSVDAAVAARAFDAGFVHGFTTRRAWIGGDGDPLLMGRVDTIAVDAFLAEETACVLS